jgi:hypothetical protein
MSRLRVATVEIPELRRRAVADERGYFVLAGVPAGQHTLRADAFGSLAAERQELGAFLVY